MVIIQFEHSFEKKIKKLKGGPVKDLLKKQIAKIIDSPETGKPMKYERKGTREVYIPPFRLSYAYFKEEDKLIFLDLYHKDEQ
jgi:mRNA-degrading endonuclease RelE of RelBE toxin-antitoxin system